MLLALPSVSRGDGRTYFQVVYDFEVAAQCGFASEDVERAFRLRRDREAVNSRLDPKALRRLRLRAMVAADREYDNRGLGGHRRWCANEGRQGVRRLLDHLR
jgi:hypothetical protein